MKGPAPADMQAESTTTPWLADCVAAMPWQTPIWEPRSPKANADLLVGHPERWTDWGWRSTHEMTIAAKQIVQAFYGREPERAYFDGCSTGGEQALMEAQRFPDDYNGIVAGAPANNRTHLHMAILWNHAAGRRTPAGDIPKAKLPMITEALLNACAKAKAASHPTHS